MPKTRINEYGFTCVRYWVSYDRPYACLLACRLQNKGLNGGITETVSTNGLSWECWLVVENGKRDIYDIFPNINDWNDFWSSTPKTLQEKNWIENY